MSIFDTLDTATQAIEDAYDALEEKGATIPAQKNLDNMLASVNSLSLDGGYVSDFQMSSGSTRNVTDSESGKYWSWGFYEGTASDSQTRNIYVSNSGTEDIIVLVGTKSTFPSSTYVTVIAPGTNQQIATYYNSKCRVQVIPKSGLGKYIINHPFTWNSQVSVGGLP